MSMLYKASAIISANGFLHLNEYYYSHNKTRLQILQSFLIATSVPLTREWFFSWMSIAIETPWHYQNRPIIAVWRKQWEWHLNVAIINALLIAVWSSRSLLIAIQSQFEYIKDYCEIHSHICSSFNHLIPERVKLNSVNQAGINLQQFQSWLSNLVDGFLYNFLIVFNVVFGSKRSVALESMVRSSALNSF